MILQTLLTELSTTTGIVDSSRLLAIANLAGLEVWNHSDFPGTLEEAAFQMSEEKRVTFPWYVQFIRGVKACDGLPVELNTPRPAYFDSTWLLDSHVWRDLQVTPLERELENASTVTISRPTAENRAVKFILIGPTDLASECTEVITLPAGEKSVESTNRFTDFIEIYKDVLNDVDFTVTDASDNVIARIPNHLYSARNTVWQIHDDCLLCSCSCSCIWVLYKPLFVGWRSADSSLREEMYLPVLWKAREIAAVAPDTDITYFIQKFQNAYKAVGANRAIGKTQRMNGARNMFTTSVPGYL